MSAKFNQSNLISKSFPFEFPTEKLNHLNSGIKFLDYPISTGFDLLLFEVVSSPR